LAFPSTPVGSTSTATITLANTGMAPLSLYSFAASGDFQVSSQCPDYHASLAAGAACSVAVSFAPTAGGPRTGTLTIGHDGKGRTLQAGLVGTGTQPKLVFVPDMIDFGPQGTGTTSQPPRAVTLRNDGDASLTVNSVTATAGFDIASSDCPGAQVAPGGGTCTIQVTFSPLQARQAVGELTVTYDGGRLASMTLRGLGT
jgi:hypothetical protein